MRKDSKTIPGKKELSKILKKEAKRNLPPGKKDVHYPDFSLAIRLFNIYGNYGSIFKEKIREGEFVEKARKILDKVTKRILSDKNLKKNKNLFKKIYVYLSEEDKPQKSDLIFVFAALTLARAEKAVELYKRGFAPLIIFSGCSPIYQKKKLPEAKEYEKFALSEGVPQNSILVEDNSITIPDNVRTSLNLLDKLRIKPKRIILVNSPYVERRGWVHFKKYLPDKVRLIRVNCSTRTEYSKENWFKNENGIRAILNEFIKMRIAVILNTA